MLASMKYFMKGETVTTFEDDILYPPNVKHIKICINTDNHPSLISLIYNLCCGDVFGSEMMIQLALLEDSGSDIDHEVIPSMFALSSFPNLMDIYTTSNDTEALTDSDLVIFLEITQGNNEGKKEMEDDYSYFRSKAKIIESVAKNGVRILMVGENACLYATAIANFAPSIPKQNITGLSRHFAKRAATELAHKLKIHPRDVKNIIVLGKDVPDITNIKITERHTTRRPYFTDIDLCNENPEVYNIITSAKLQRKQTGNTLQEEASTNNKETAFSFWDTNQRWLKKKLYQKVSSPIQPMALAQAISKHLKVWWHGSQLIENMIVISNGSYNIPEGLYCSFPVYLDISNKWVICEDFSILLNNADIIKYQVLELNQEFQIIKSITDKYYKNQEVGFNVLSETNENDQNEETESNTSVECTCHNNQEQFTNFNEEEKAKEEVETPCEHTRTDTCICNTNPIFQNEILNAYFNEEETTQTELNKCKCERKKKYLNQVFDTSFTEGITNKCLCNTFRMYLEQLACKLSNEDVETGKDTKTPSEQNLTEHEGKSEDKATNEQEMTETFTDEECTKEVETRSEQMINEYFAEDEGEYGETESPSNQIINAYQELGCQCQYSNQEKTEGKTCFCNTYSIYLEQLPYQNQDEKMEEASSEQIGITKYFKCNCHIAAFRTCADAKTQSERAGTSKDVKCICNTKKLPKKNHK